jgi:hypothetical protein
MKEKRLRYKKDINAKFKNEIIKKRDTYFQKQVILSRYSD